MKLYFQYIVSFLQIQQKKIVLDIILFVLLNLKDYIQKKMFDLIDVLLCINYPYLLKIVIIIKL